MIRLLLRRGRLLAILGGLVLLSSQTAQGITFDEIKQAQTQGQVLGASTITRVQEVTPAASVCTTTTCTLTVAATQAGDLGVIILKGGATATNIVSVSGGGTWNAGSKCFSSYTGSSVDLAYNLSLTGGATTITVTANNNYATYADFIEYSNGGGTWALDGACASLSSQPATTHPTSPSITTTGGDDVIVTGVATLGMHYGTAAVSGTGWASPFTLYLPGPAFTNTQSAADDALNVGPGTYQATFTNGSAAAFSSSALAFSASGGTPITLPTISAVTASGITNTAASITWTTDIASDSQVLYGTSTPVTYPYSSALNSSLVTSHSVSLSGLVAATTYHYVVQSRDSGGNLVVSADNTFTTAATAPAPSIATFTASPASVSAGQSSTLSWSVSGATSLSISNGPGTQTSLTSGSVSVFPSVTTTYVLTATNAQGSVTSSATVTVSSSGGSAVSSGPAVLDDWACAYGATAAPYTDSAGKKTTQITCPRAHGFPAGTYIRILGATGAWGGINTRQNIELLSVMSTSSLSAWVNDTNYVEPGTWTITGGLEQFSISSASNNQIFISGRGLNSTTIKSHLPEEVITGPNTRQIVWSAVPTGSNTFALYTMTGLPIDSSTFGSFSGQNIMIERTRGSGDYRAAIQYINSNGGGGYGYPTNNGTYEAVVPTCADKTNVFQCAIAYTDPQSQKGYYDFAAIATNGLVVSGGVGTANLTAPFTQRLTVNTRVFQVGEPIWLWGIDEGSDWTGVLNRPWIISAISADKKTITINGMGAAGVPDGTYTPKTTGCGDNPCGKNILFGMPASPYVYLYPCNAALSGCTYPTKTIGAHVETTYASFNQLSNHFRVWIKYNKTITAPPSPTETFNVGTYWFSPNGGGNHLYHVLNANAYAGQWQLIDVSSVPYHEVGEDALTPFFENTTAVGWLDAPNWDGGVRNYWDGIAALYLDSTGGTVDWSGQNVEYALPQLEYVSDSPDEYLQSTLVQYNGSAYELSARTSGPNIAPVSYQIRSSPTSLKSAGWSTGSGITTIANTNDSNWDIHFTSSPMALGNMYFDVRPVMPIYSAAPDSSGNIWFSLERDPNMQVGDHITTANITCSAGSCTPYNQTNAVITAVQPRQIWRRFMPATGNAYISGTVPGPLQDIVSDGSTCTVDLTVSHNLYPGMSVGVYGTPAGGPSPNTTEKFFTVTATPSATQFQFSCPGTTAGTYNTDYSPSVHFAVLSNPAVAISGSGAGTYASGGTLVSTEEHKNFAEVAYFPPQSGTIPTPPPPASAPTINSFSASVNPISVGGSTTLSYSVANATSVSLDNGLGNQSNTSTGTVTVSPTVTTTYTLTATNSGGTVTSQVTVVVNNAPDTTAPTAAITAPASGSTVSGSITVSATASDPTVAGQVTSGLNLVTITVDGGVFATSTAGSLSKSLDTTTLTNGSHTVAVTAKDNAGNISTASSVTITVSNQAAQKFSRLVTLTSLEGLSTIPANTTITAQVVSPANGSVLETESNLTSNAQGQYTITFQATDPQLVNIRIEPTGYLSRLLTGIDTTINSSSALSVPQPLAGDLNNDNTINSLDYSLMNSHFLQNFSSADINKDSLVNSLDFAILKNNYGKSGQ